MAMLFRAVTALVTAARPPLRSRPRRAARAAVAAGGALLAGLIVSCGTQSTSTGGEVLRFLTASLPAAYQNEPYTQEVLLTAGTRPYTLRVTKGALPPGITLVNRTLSGVPTDTKTYTFTLEASDANLSVVSREYTLDVRATPPATLEVRTPPTAVSGELRVPFTLKSARLVRSVNATFTLPKGVEVVSVEAGPSKPLVLWDVKDGVLRVNAALTAAPKGREDVPVFTVLLRGAESFTLPASALKYELRAGGKTVGSTATAAATPAAPETPATPSGSSTGGTETPAETPTENPPTENPPTENPPAENPEAPGAPTSPETPPSTPGGNGGNS